MNGARENFLKSLVPCSPKSDTRSISPDGDSEESKAITIKLSISIVSDQLSFLGDCQTKWLTIHEKFVAWWNENHPDCQIKVDSIEEWTYRENEDPSSYNVHWIHDNKIFCERTQPYHNMAKVPPINVEGTTNIQKNKISPINVEGTIKFTQGHSEILKLYYYLET
uniref:Uncharacterized protein n=1 Tax=Rhizophagus irregularis (strain DAOM 181602 / DAOM 197198 / MUCL 43194) TaxID=747089 RepID=U9T394_RHIID